MNSDTASTEDNPYGSTSTEELVRIAFSEVDRYAFHSALGTLQHRGSRDVFESACKLCNSEDADEMILGAEILGQLGIPERAFPDESLEVMLELLHENQDPDVLGSVGIALGHLGHPGAIEPLATLKTHASADVRHGVVFGLLSHECELAINTLIELSSDPDLTVRNWATFGLGSQIETDTPAIRAALFQRLIGEDRENDDTYEIYGEALVGLASRKDVRVLDPLIEELCSDCVGVLALEAAEAMADARLYPALMTLQQWWHGNSGYLDDAIASCHPEKS